MDHEAGLTNNKPEEQANANSKQTPEASGQEMNANVERPSKSDSARGGYQEPPGTPPPLTPPPIIQTPQPERKGRSVWRIISLILIIAALVGGIMLLRGCVSLFSVSGTTISAEPMFVETVLEENNAKDKILVIDITGIIYDGPFGGDGLTMPELIRKQLKKAEEDNYVKAVVLRIDSPGGEVLTADEISRAIEEFQARSKKPVIASMGSVAASGGYYIAAPCRWIVANELTITGSIGVILHTWNYRGLMNKVGLKPVIFKSGRFKDMLSGERDLDNMTPEEAQIFREEKRMVQQLIDETFEAFKAVVEKGRNNAAAMNKNEGRRLANNWTEFADGRILSGKQAYNLGFVDELGNFQTAVKRAKKLSGIIGDANLIQYRIPLDLSKLLSLFVSKETKAIKLDLGIDNLKLEAGKMYFLSPALIH